VIGAGRCIRSTRGSVFPGGMGVGLHAALTAASETHENGSGLTPRWVQPLAGPYAGWKWALRARATAWRRHRANPGLSPKGVARGARGARGAE
jgi:hypothetical protein